MVRMASSLWLPATAHALRWAFGIQGIVYAD
jgi:hypothetical protein